MIARSYCDETLPNSRRQTVELLLCLRQNPLMILKIFILKLLTNFDVNMTSFLGGVLNYVSTVYFITPLGDDVELISKFVRSFSFFKFFEMIRGFFLEWSRSSKIIQNVIFHVKLHSLTSRDCRVTVDVLNNLYSESLRDSFHYNKLLKNK